jgi:Domain of unknown function (DUF4349)
MSESLLNEIRASKPVAPSALRDRVRALSAEEPAREPFLARLRWRQLVLVAPVTLVLALSAATVIGLTRDDAVTRGGDQIAASGAGEAATTPSSSRDFAQPLPNESNDALRALGAPQTKTGSVPPAAGQLQRYEAELRLRVDDVDALSEATKSAQRIALSHGGSIASLQYDAPSEGIGSAQITLRVPISKVQSAMTELSALGTIVGQRYGIEDLQVQADTLEKQIEATQRQIAGILGQLESTTLSDANRAVLKSRLANARVKLKGLREGLAGTRAEAKTATIYLSLTTEKIEPGAVGGGPLDNVKDVLAWEAIGLLYALVIAGPFIIVGFLVWLALRLRRRQVNTRLLEQN